MFFYFNSLKRILVFACVVAALAATLKLFIDHVQDAEGIPAIEVSVEKQFNDLIGQSPNLKDLTLGANTKRYVSKEGDSLTGYFRYDARKSGTPVDLLVYWEKNPTACQITRVESDSTYAPPQILWKMPAPASQ